MLLKKTNGKLVTADEILLMRYEKLFTNFRRLLFNVKLAPSCLNKKEIQNYNEKWVKNMNTEIISKQWGVVVPIRISFIGQIDLLENY